MCCKSVQYQEAAHVPLLVRLPGGRNGGQRVGGAFSQIDLVPTLLELMGEKAPAGLHGQSRAAVLDAPGNQRLTDDVVIEWNANDDLDTGDKKGKAPPPQVAELGSPEEIQQAMADSIRTLVTQDGWKLNCSEGCAHELFNLQADPGETTNLATRPEHRERMRDMRRRLIAWQQRTADPLTLREV
jgi:arylsulfatase A-like enzyme